MSIFRFLPAAATRRSFRRLGLAALAWCTLAPNAQAQSLAAETEPLRGASTHLTLPAATTPTLAPPFPEGLPATVADIADDGPRVPTFDLTIPPDDLWQRIRNGFGMPDLETPSVTSHQAWYLNRPELLRNTFTRASKYLFHIVEELEKRGMPTELALLPFVESSFNPQAQSPARALGMWQFIPSTGKNYDLNQNWWMDERRDIIASTNAALEYLQNIYEMNGDWHLALASYNWGEGAVARAMAKNAAKGLPTDYLSIKMPDETRYYVPKLQAIKNIIANPQIFNFRLDPIPNRPYFATVGMDRNVDVSIAANLAEIPLKDFIALNPAYSRPVIPGHNDNPLVIPAEKLAIFMANLEHYENTSKPLSNWYTHQLKPKEKIDSVAKRFGISGAKLRRLNGITKRTKVVPGMTLLVPGPNALQSEAVADALPKTAEYPDKRSKNARLSAASKGKAAAKGKVASKSSGKSASKRSNARKSSVKAQKKAPVRKVATKTTAKTAAKTPAKKAPASK